MLIDKAEIERVKQANDLVALIQSKGIRLTRKGKQYVGLCPFHSDHEPSLIVDPKKQLWNCLGACREGGDVYKFVMKSEGLDFRQAHLRLGGSDLPVGSNASSLARGARRKPGPAGRAKTAQPAAPDSPPPLAVEEQRWLKKAVEHYRRRLLYTPAAQQYLVDRGIKITEVISIFDLGHVDGTLLEILPPEGIEVLKRVGVLTEQGQELMRKCIVFPLVNASGRVVSLYGRHTERRLHLYLHGPHRGIFNPNGARSYEEVILTESVIDAAALWGAGLHNVIPAYDGVNGLTEEILDHLAECRVRKVCLMLDSDEAGRAAGAAFAARLAERHIESRVVELPAKDPADFFAQGGTVQQVRAILQGEPGSAAILAAAPASGLRAEHTSADPPAAPDGTAGAEAAAQSEDPSPEREPVLESTPEGVLTFTAANREYRIRGLTATGLDRLRVNLRLRVNGSFQLDTLDLYQARSRSAFAQAAAKQCGVAEAQVGKDLLELIERLEAARLQMSPAGSSSKAPEIPMTAPEREAALAYLKAPNLLERIVDDFRACGLIGERSSVLVSYLAAISRKLAKPLSLLIVARTGAGKSSLQDALCSLVPPEEVRVTRLTGQALFYKDPDSLKHKLLAIAEEEGAAQAAYSLRTLASDQWLSIAATRTDPQTGKLHTEHYEIHGPVAIVITTTSPEAFDEETRSRFVLLTLNESVEQTRAILARQRQSDTLEGVLAEANAEHIHRRHHHLQRLLRPLKVVNPYSQQLDYPDEKLIARREQKKYLTLIKSMALLHQYQREIKRAATPQGARSASEGIEVEYVEVTPEDIRLANELAREVLWQSWDELAPPVRGLKQELEKLYQSQAQALKIDSGDVQLTRRQIREATGWSDWQVRVYCQRLVEMEYLLVVAPGNGRPCLYQLVEPGRDDRPQLDSLAEIPAAAVPGAVATGSTVQQLKKKANG
jgi:energy-coupling factor transporter ATP-binding protein EcfA2